MDVMSHNQIAGKKIKVSITNIIVNIPAYTIYTLTRMNDLQINNSNNLM